VAAVADTFDGKAETFAKSHNIPTSYESYDKLARNPDLDIIYVATLNAFHYPIARLMLDAGKNVLVEKPIGLDRHQANDLINVAKEKKLFLMEGVWSRFFPVHQHLRKELAAGTIGDVSYLTATAGLRMKSVARVQQKHLGGGIMYDLGIYATQLVLTVFDHEMPTEIHATGHLNEEGVDESVSMNLLFSGKRLANVCLSSKLDLPNDATIVGSKGTIKMNPNFWNGTELQVDQQTHHYPLPPLRHDVRLNYTNSSGFCYEAREVRNCLTQGMLECPLVTHSDTLKIHAIMDEVRRQVGCHVPEEFERASVAI
jgi:dihydrodiol dehydrogenase / D-xylose 1-dehydrogenase (NADP)